MILSCILLRKMDIVVVSGFGAAIGLGRSGEIWALAKDAKTETYTMPTGTTTRAIDRNIKNPPIYLRVQVSCQDSGFFVSTHWPSRSAVTSSGCGTRNLVSGKPDSITRAIPIGLWRIITTHETRLPVDLSHPGTRK